MLTPFLADFGGETSLSAFGDFRSPVLGGGLVALAGDLKGVVTPLEALSLLASGSGDFATFLEGVSREDSAFLFLSIVF